jgi:diguanylate cyclase (GGDEF)-like protein
VSFRGRLSLFFTIIVVVPMVAVAVVLFALTAESETGKADSRIAGGMRVAFELYDRGSTRAEDELRRVARDQALTAAVRRRSAGQAGRRMAALLRADPSIASIAFYDPSGTLLAEAGGKRGIAPASVARTAADGRRIGTLAVSVTTARRYAREVKRLTGLEVRIRRGGVRLASTLPGAGDEALRSGDVEVNGRDYRGRLERIDELAGPPVELALLQEADELSSSITDSRVLIGAILLAFLMLALASTLLVVRSLQRQVGQFLEAARRLAAGDFAHPVPTEGRDEFAALGSEFNNMSVQLATKIAEVERRQGQLEGTIRRVGDAIAAGHNRQEAVELAVRTAVDACEATAGRVLPIDGRAITKVHTGAHEPDLLAAMEAAEREAFKIHPEVGAELMSSGDSGTDSSRTRPAEARRDGIHALAVPMRARLGTRGHLQYVGVVSIARHGSEFTDSEQDILDYLARNAAVFIENADLHETVQRQAVTDELTGLSNIRQFHRTMDREIERTSRFETPLGLVMIDIDDFKQVNDTLGHQQGDEVLVEVARVLRELSRDIDEPARYGGEELVAVLPQTDAAGAAMLAERMRSAIERLHVPRLDGDGTLAVTASFGVASIPESAFDRHSLIAAADAALYRAKRAGKNRVQRADPAPAPR